MSINRIKIIDHRYPLALVCCALFVGCGSTEPTSNLLIFEGVVSDAANGAPIVGASVSFGDGSGIGLPVGGSATDAQGKYTLSHDGCVNNPYLTVLATHYSVGSKQVGCQIARQTINFSLTRDPQAP